MVKNTAAFLFKITSRCNDDCKFCIEKKYDDGKKNDDLSLNEIKRSYLYLKNIFRPDKVIITGGEPTLHPRLFDVIGYLGKTKIRYKIITNLLNFSSGNYVRKIAPYFSPNKAGMITGSINGLPCDKISRKRMKGLENLLKNRLLVSLITVISQDNLETLPKLIFYLSRLYKKYGFKSVNLELRLIYLEDTLVSLLGSCLPVDFGKLKKYMQKTVEAADSAGVNLTLWNFPLCYLEKIPRYFDKGVQERREKKLLKISKNFQMEKVQIRDFEKCFMKKKTCLGCRYSKFCSGIEKEYIRKFKFPVLKRIK